MQAGIGDEPGICSFHRSKARRAGQKAVNAIEGG
jgi:hypothetical protein